MTWLPNQLQAVLSEMVSLNDRVGGPSLGTECEDIMDLVYRQKETLTKEVNKYCEERGVKQD